MIGLVPKIQQLIVSQPFIANNPKIKGLLIHPAGPFTSINVHISIVHFWAPTCKWLISIANIIDISRPVENMSLAQQSAVSLTGVLWSYYSLVIIPKNYNLFSVNVVMGATGIYHLCRVIKYVQEFIKLDIRYPREIRAKLNKSNNYLFLYE